MDKGRFAKCPRRQPAGTYGFWRGILDGVVARYLDCGIFERGFARIRCPDCATEFSLAFSCKGRGLCPSCGAKRAAEFAAFLQDEVVADVGHAQWVFTVPKLLRPYFMHHRGLLGPLCAAAWQTVREPMGGLNSTEVDVASELVQRIRSAGVTIILVEHVMKAIMRISDRVVVINQGEKIAEGPPARVVEEPAVLAAYFGKRVA